MARTIAIVGPSFRVIPISNDVYYIHCAPTGSGRQRRSELAAFCRLRGVHPVRDLAYDTVAQLIQLRVGPLFSLRKANQRASAIMNYCGISVNCFFIIFIIRISRAGRVGELSRLVIGWILNRLMSGGIQLIRCEILFGLQISCKCMAFHHTSPSGSFAAILTPMYTTKYSFFRIFRYLMRSTRCAFFCTAPISKC